MLKFLKSFEPRLLMLAAGVVGALWAFLSIADEVMEGETLAVDRQLLLLLRSPGDPTDPIGSRKVEEAIRDVTALGGFTVLTLVTAVAVIAFLLHKRWRHALVMLGAALVGELCSDLLKSAYGRPRPDLVPHGSYVYSASFPSGHSLHAAVVFLTLAMLISSLETHRSTKMLAYSLAILILVAVGFSRVYLGVHWPTDVLGGWCLGAAVALGAWMALIGLGGRPRKAVD